MIGCCGTEARLEALPSELELIALPINLIIALRTSGCCMGHDAGIPIVLLSFDSYNTSYDHGSRSVLQPKLSWRIFTVFRPLQHLIYFQASAAPSLFLSLSVSFCFPCFDFSDKSNAFLVCALTTTTSQSISRVTYACSCATVTWLLRLCFMEPRAQTGDSSPHLRRPLRLCALGLFSCDRENVHAN
jgi:hypothetical protein